MNIPKPTRNRVLLKQLEASQVIQEGSILIPDQAKVKPDVYQVVSVGPLFDAKNRPVTDPGFKIGDCVAIQKFSGGEKVIDGVVYYLLDWTDVLLVVNFEAAA